MTNNLNLYKESLKTMTPLEFSLKCHVRAIDFIEDAIECLQNNDKTNFIVNLNNALTILENFMYSLQFTNSDGSTNKNVSKFFLVYEYITFTLRQGLMNFNDKDFDNCCNFLNEIYNAYNNTNPII